MKQYNLLIVVLIFAIPSFGQKGYYRSDSTTRVGITLANSGIWNSYYCSVKKGDGEVKYTPFQVSEYGFNQGEVYKAFDIVIDDKRERYFFEHLVTGNINLYNLKLKGGINKYYILPADSSKLQELASDKEELQDLISTYTVTCPHASQNLRYLKPKKHSLKKYLNYLNSCSNYPYPKIQYGFKIGVAGTQFYPIDESSNYAILDYNSDISITLGAFIDLPILSSNLSFAPEIYFKGNHYSRSLNNSQKSFDLIMNYSSLCFPLLFKYSFIRDGNIPFIQLGPIYTRAVKNEATLYQYEIIDNDIFIEKNESPIFQKNMGGFSLGSGIIIDSEKSYKWFGEVRYSYLFNLNSKEKNFNLGEFSINAGVLF